MAKPDRISFSVIVPTHNRPQQLALCVASLFELDYPGDLIQVIVVDDASDEPCDSVVKELGPRGDVTLLRHERRTGPAGARNTGAAQARGEVLAFIDDDCTADAKWLSAFAEVFAQRRDCFVGGHTWNALIDNPYSSVSQMLIDYLYDQRESGAARSGFFASNNLAVPKGLFTAIGGFDPTFPRAAAEDRDLCERWTERGYQMVYRSDAIVHHRHAMNRSSFVRQHFNYGRGAYRLRAARQRRGQPPIPLESLRFYWRMFEYPGVRYSGLRWLQISSLLLVTQLANAAGFFWERWRMLRMP